jgi:tRNA(adenine34) deaminase
VLTHQDFMQEALKQAKLAESKNEVPVGCVIVQNNLIIAKGYNSPITNCDPTAHAEIIALRNAAKKLNNYRILNTTLYVTLEPCMMCLGALTHARISTLVYGANDPKLGAARQFWPQTNTIEGILAEECAMILKNFFEIRR